MKGVVGSFLLHGVGICALLMATSCHAISQNSEETETLCSAVINACGCAWSPKRGGVERWVVFCIWRAWCEGGGVIFLCTSFPPMGQCLKLAHSAVLWDEVCTRHHFPLRQIPSLLAKHQNLQAQPAPLTPPCSWQPSWQSVASIYPRSASEASTENEIKFWAVTLEIKMECSIVGFSLLWLKTTY